MATAAQIVAPLLVGFSAQSFGTGRAFLAFAAYCALYVLVGLLLPRYADLNSRGATKQRGLVEGLRLLPIRGMRVVVFLTFARLWNTTAWTAFFPLLLVTSGTAEGTASTVVSAMAVVGTILSPFSGRLNERFQAVSLTAFSLACGVPGLALSPLLDSVPAAYAASVLLGIGHGISLPMLLVLISAAAPMDKRGLALGLRASVNQAAAAAAPPLVALVLGATAASVGFPLAGAVGLSFITAAVLTSRGGRGA